MQIKTIMQTIEKRKVAIGKERDKLRDFISELEELEETCSRAYDDLQNAVHALSELT